MIASMLGRPDRIVAKVWALVVRSEEEDREGSGSVGVFSLSESATTVVDVPDERIG